MKKLIPLLFLLGCAEAATTCLKLPTPTPTPTPTATPTVTATPTPAPGTITLGGDNYTIASHPRFTTSSRLSALQARSVAGKTLWNQLTINNNGYAGSCSNPTFADTPLYSLSVGFLSDPTKTTWRDCAKTYFNKIKTLTTAFNVQDYGRMDLAVWAYAYDFLAGALTTQEKSEMRDWVFATWIPWIRGHSYDVYKGSGDCVNDKLHNLCLTSLWGQYLFGLACVGEDYRCDDLVTASYNWYHQASVKTVIDTVFVGCNNFSGSSYGIDRVTPYLLEVADAETTALGMSASWMTWMNSCPQRIIHSALPEFTKTGCPYASNVCAPLNAEWSGNDQWTQGRNARSLLIPMERDRTTSDNRRAQDWFVVTHPPVTAWGTPGRVLGDTTYGGKEYLAEWHLRYDQDAARTDYTGWDTTYVATGLGRVYSRSAWGKDDKFWMTANASSFVTDHSNTGCGSFKVFNNGEYGIVENGPRYAVMQKSDDATSMIKSNILWLSDGVITGGLTTGGFPYYGSASTCTIPKYSYGATYAYWHENLDAAYHVSFPMTYARRNFWHFKPITIGAASSTQNYVVLMDSVAPTNSITVQQQFFVPKTSPTVSDPDVSFTLTNTKTMIRRIYPTGGTIASANQTDLSSNCIQCGSGMAKVTNPDSAGTSHFLGVVISQAGTSATLGATTAINGATNALKGVMIEDTVPRIALGPAANGTVSGTFAFDATPSAAAEYVICGLTAAQKYDHSFSTPTHTMTRNDSTGAITVDSMGCVRFTD